MADTAATGTDPGQIDAARATALKEDTLSRFASASYRHAGSSVEIQALQFIDATGASAALSLYRAANPGLRLLPAGQKLGTESSLGPEEAVFRSGNTVVIARGAHLQPRRPAAAIEHAAQNRRPARHVAHAADALASPRARS